jgi:hypothetical protein
VVLALFRRLTCQQPGAASPPQESGTAALVVGLGGHPCFAAGFGAMTCGEVSAARAALGLAAEEFAGWLGTAAGWTPAPGTVVAWESLASVPPGDVVMAARFCLAGAR